MHARSIFCYLMVVLSAIVSARAQTALTWTSASSGQWTTASNWSPATVPNSLTLYDAIIAATGSAYTITASGSSSLSVHTLSMTSANANLVVNFSSSGNSFSLGAGSSALSAGLIDFQTSNGLFGAGSALSTLAIASGAELRFSTAALNRNLNSVTVNNAGLIQASSGPSNGTGLSISNTALNNLSGGVVHANGTEIDFFSGTSLVNGGTLRATGTSGILNFASGFTITTTALGNVDLVSGGRALLQGTLTNTGATLSAPSGGTFELRGGTINNGTVGPAAVTFTGNGGTLNNVSLNDTLTLPASTYVYFTGGTSFTGTTGTLNNNSSLYWQQAGTLSGKTFTFGSGSRLEVLGANNSLTFGSNASGNLQIYSDGSTGSAITSQGTLTHTSGYGSLYAPTFLNSGNITASAGSSLDLGYYYAGNYSTTNGSTGTITADGATIYLNGNVANQGTLAAQNSGALVFRTGYGAAQTTANIGAVQLASGGHAYLDGTVDNTGATLNAPSGGAFELHGGTIAHGAVAASALTFTGNGGTLNNVTLNDTLTLPASTYVYFTGGTSFTGATGTLNNNSSLYWQQAGTLSGKTFTFGSGSRLEVVGTNNTLTFGSNASGNLQIYSDGSSGSAITNQGTLTHTSGYGSLYAPTFLNSGNITASSGSSLDLGYYYASNYSTTNGSTGVVTADGVTIYLNGNIANQGTLVAQNSGALVFRTGYGAAQTTANIGKVQLASGGHAYLDGTVDNTGATLSAPTGGTFELHGGTIANGTVAASALTFTGNGGTLNNVSLNDTLTLPASTSVYFTGATSFTGATGTLNNNSSLYWQQAGTLSGKTFTFGSGSRLEVVGTNNTLTFGSNASGNLQIYSDGSTGSALTTQGTLAHTTGYGSLYAPTFLNSGNITASAGSSLDLGYYYASNYATTNGSTGTITADGATIYLNGNVANLGTLAAQNAGALYFRSGYGAAQTTANIGTVQIASGGHAYLSGTVDNTGATLNAPSGGSFELYGGTINNGTIAPAALTFTGNGGTLNNLSLNDTFTLPASTSVHFTGGASFTGTTGTLNNNSSLYWQQAGTLSGKTFTFGSNSRIEVVGTNNSLTFGSNASGNLQIYSDGSTGSAITTQGTLTHSTGYGSLYAPTFLNSGNITASAGSSLDLGYYYASSYSTTNGSNGVVTADGANTTIYLNGNIANQGTVVAQNSGALVFRTGYGAAQTTANIGKVQLATGGHAYLDGTIDNTGATLNAPSGGMFELHGGTIANGAVAASALTFTGNGGTLNNVSLNDTLTLPASTSVYFTGGTSFTGATGTLNNNSSLYWQQAATLSGKTFTFGSNSRIEVVGTNNSLTFGSNASGNLQIYSDGSTGSAITTQGTLTHSTGYGSLYAPTFLNSGNITASAGSSLDLGYYYASNYSTTNGSTGTITADGANTTLNLNGNVANQGTIVAQNSGSVVFRSGYGAAQTTANLGKVQIVGGGHAYFAGTLDNTAATLLAPTGGPFELYGGTINNGSVAASALSFTCYGGTLNNVALLDPALNLPASASVTFTNGTDFTSGLTLGASSTLYWDESGTMAGRNLTFGNGSTIYLNSTGASLTLASNTTATGTVRLYSDSYSSGTSILNQGTLTNTSGTGYLYARSFANTGTITASGGNLNLGVYYAGYSFANNLGGSINITNSAATVQLAAPASTAVTNNGAISVQSGTLYTNSQLTNGSTGRISGAGTIVGSLTMAGGTLDPGNGGVGTLTISSGTLTVTQPTTFAVDISGSTSDRLLFQNPGSTVNLGTGLLAISLTLLAPPTANTTYNLIQIGSGSNIISGSFAGLSTTGDALTASYGGTPYLFTVNYAPTLVSLNFTPVPEPSTWALFGFGVAAVLFIGWRRRK